MLQGRSRAAAAAGLAFYGQTSRVAQTGGVFGSQLSGGGLLPKTLESFLSVSSGKNFLSQWESQRTKPTTKRTDCAPMCGRAKPTANSALTQTCLTQKRTDRRSTLVIAPKNGDNKI